MFVGKWRFDINHKCLFELFLVKGWRRLFTRSQVEANWFFAEPSEYIFCLKNLIGNQGHFTWTYMTVRGFVLNRLYIIPMMFSTYANYILWKNVTFVVCYYFTEDKAGKHKRFIYFLFSGSSICYSREAKQWIRLHNA